MVLRGEDARPWKGAVSEGGLVHREGCGKAGKVSAGPVTLSGGIGAMGRRRGGVGWRVGGGRVVNVRGRDGVRGCGGHCACSRQRGGVHLLGGRQWGRRGWGGAATGGVGSR